MWLDGAASPTPGSDSSGGYLYDLNDGQTDCWWDLPSPPPEAGGRTEGYCVITRPAICELPALLCPYCSCPLSNPAHACQGSRKVQGSGRHLPTNWTRPGGFRDSSSQTGAGKKALPRLEAVPEEEEDGEDEGDEEDETAPR